MSYLLELNTTAFMKFYREEFPRDTYPKATVLPKMHLLEDHMMEWLGRYYLGAGLIWRDNIRMRTNSYSPNGVVMAVFGISLGI